MKTKRSAILVLAVCVLVLVAHEALAFYNPQTGRWLSRDPIGEIGFALLGGGTQTATGTGLDDESSISPTEEQGGENLYGFVGNDPIRLFDILGLRWKVDRKGGGKAPAEPEAGDTVADLANLIGLNAADYQKWLTPVRGTTMPSSSSQRLTTCDKFEIPNTVVAYWAGDLGWAGRWWVRWNSSVKYLGKRGFNVDDQRHQKGSTWALQTSLESKAGAKELHGLYFWGHGSAPYPAKYLVSSSGDAHPRSAQYKRARAKSDFLSVIQRICFWYTWKLWATTVCGCGTRLVQYENKGTLQHPVLGRRLRQSDYVSRTVLDRRVVDSDGPKRHCYLEVVETTPENCPEIP